MTEDFMFWAFVVLIGGFLLLDGVVALTRWVPTFTQLVISFGEAHPQLRWLLRISYIVGAVVLYLHFWG